MAWEDDSDSESDSGPGLESPELRLSQALIFSVPVFFTFVILALFYGFYLRRRRTNWESLRTRTPYQARTEIPETSPGVKKEVRDLLPVVIFKESFLIRETQCSVCLADYKPEECLKKIPPCGHTFHVDCIDGWLSAHATCPLCRVSIVGAIRSADDDSRSDSSDLRAGGGNSRSISGTLRSGSDDMRSGGSNSSSGFGVARSSIEDSRSGAENSRSISDAVRSGDGNSSSVYDEMTSGDGNSTSSLGESRSAVKDLRSGSGDHMSGAEDSRSSSDDCNSRFGVGDARLGEVRSGCDESRSGN